MYSGENPWPKQRENNVVWRGACLQAIGAAVHHHRRHAVISMRWLTFAETGASIIIITLPSCVHPWLHTALSEEVMHMWWVRSAVETIFFNWLIRISFSICRWCLLPFSHLLQKKLGHGRCVNTGKHQYSCSDKVNDGTILSWLGVAIITFPVTNSEGIGPNNDANFDVRATTYLKQTPHQRCTVVKPWKATFSRKSMSNAPCHAWLVVFTVFWSFSSKRLP